MTHPYLPLYVDDYEAATAHLTAEEDGVYNRLMRLCWRTPGCSVPNDDAWIARKIRLSAADFERVAKPVIEEFFKVQRGRLIQKRLKEEYDDISRKKSRRVKAGKMGGDAKALKTKETGSSNATVLPAHTRAFPEPYPEPEERKDANASSVAAATKPKPKARSYPEAFEAAWRAYPHHKGRSSKPNAASEWAKLPEDERAGLPAAIARFAPNVAETCGGKGAPDMAVWLKAGKHLNWQGDDVGVDAPKSTFNDARVRASIVQATDEDFARSYVDPYCRWVPNGRRLEAAKPAVVAALTARLSAWAKAKEVTIAVTAANDTPAPTLFADEGAAA